MSDTVNFHAFVRHLGCDAERIGDLVKVTGLIDPGNYATPTDVSWDSLAISERQQLGILFFLFLVEQAHFTRLSALVTAGLIAYRLTLSAQGQVSVWDNRFVRLDEGATVVFDTVKCRFVPDTQQPPVVKVTFNAKTALERVRKGLQDGDAPRPEEPSNHSVSQRPEKASS